MAVTRRKVGSKRTTRPAGARVQTTKRVRGGQKQTRVPRRRKQQGR